MSELSPTRWLRIKELFDLALEQPTGERERWVEATTASDPVARRELLSLLAALDHARETLERPAAHLVSELPADLDESSLVGRRVGAYDVVRLIGFGGMGAVYEGVRADGDFDKRVAIKFLRAGNESELALQRFRYERQILASLNHKNIAALLDGGMTSDGQPYFVMEYVDGVPITTYCTARRLGVRARVSLFRQVLSAVQHAHQQLVVHRDLKPGNILVTPDGTVKLLDFGIAKLLREAEGPDQLPMTRGGVRLFTPEYASPEQVRGLALTPASDIYSSGVVLYELLTGRRPTPTEGRLLSEIEVAICTVPPRDRPSRSSRRSRRRSTRAPSHDGGGAWQATWMPSCSPRSPRKAHCATRARSSSTTTCNDGSTDTRSRHAKPGWGTDSASSSGGGPWRSPRASSPWPHSSAASCPPHGRRVLPVSRPKKPPKSTSSWPTCCRQPTRNTRAAT
ncbi:MAG: protein kinase [Gemmatimonadetes bacterium]|nr:protein kinase [Gemmatimonadota bacterium]